MVLTLAGLPSRMYVHRQTAAKGRVIVISSRTLHLAAVHGMAVTSKVMLLTAWLWRRILRQPFLILGLLVVLIGGLHMGLHGGWATGAKHDLNGRGSHALHSVDRVEGTGSRISPAVGPLRGPIVQGSNFKKPSSKQEPVSQKCSNSTLFPFKSGCPQPQDTSWDADVKGAVQPKIPGDKNSAKSLGSMLQSKPHAPFPWPRRENLMPNYFLNYNNSTPKVNSTSSDPNSVLVFLHHNKAAGTTAKECLRKVVNATDRELGHVLSNDGRLGLMSNLRKLHRRRKPIPDTYFGGYAFGVCDELKRPCSYFTILRDPYRRTLSSHSYCKTARTDQLCTALCAEKVTLRKWALHQGSFFFRQLIFHPQFCNDKTKWIPFVDLEGEPHEFVGPQNSLKDSTCWFRQKLIMSLTLNRTEHEALLQFCLDNLEKWFTVIMLVDEFDLSLDMLEKAYKLPFHELCSGHHANIGSYDKYRNTTSFVKPNIPSTNSYTLDHSIKEQLHQLQEDPEVRDALRADMMIYQKGVEIFENQKTVFMKLNSVGSR